MQKKGMIHLRKYKEKDSAPNFMCSTVKLSEKTYTEKYSRCRTRKDLPKEPGFVYALIPFERIAADAILEVWGVSPKNEQKYQSAYIKAANETLRRSTAGMLEKVDKTNSPNKESMKKVIAIVEAYQAKLREKGARFPAPFESAQTQPQPQQQNPVKSDEKKPEKETPPTKPKDAKSVFSELLKNQPEAIERPVKDSKPAPTKKDVPVAKQSVEKSAPVQKKPVEEKPAEKPVEPKVENPQKPIVPETERAPVKEAPLLNDISKKDEHKRKTSPDGEIDFSLELTIDELLDDIDNSGINVAPELPDVEDSENSVAPEPISDKPIDNSPDVPMFSRESSEPQPVPIDFGINESDSDSNEDDDDIYAELFNK